MEKLDELFIYAKYRKNVSRKKGLSSPSLVLSLERLLIYININNQNDQTQTIYLEVLHVLKN